MDHLTILPLLNTSGSNATDIELYQVALDGLTLDILLEGFQNLLISKVEFTELNLVPVDNSYLTMSANTTIYLDNPLGNHSLLYIHSVILHVDLIYQGKSIGRLNSTLVVPLSQGDNILHVYLPNQNLSFVDQQHEDNFALFTQDFVKMNLVEFTLSGTTVVDFTTVIDRMSITNLPVDNVVSLPGLTFSLCVFCCLFPHRASIWF